MDEFTKIVEDANRLFDLIDLPAKVVEWEKKMFDHLGDKIPVEHPSL